MHDVRSLLAFAVSAPRLSSACVDQYAGRKAAGRAARTARRQGGEDPGARNSSQGSWYILHGDIMLSDYFQFVEYRIL